MSHSTHTHLFNNITILMLHILHLCPYPYSAFTYLSHASISGSCQSSPHRSRRRRRRRCRQCAFWKRVMNTQLNFPIFPLHIGAYMDAAHEFSIHHNLHTTKAQSTAHNAHIHIPLPLYDARTRKLCATGCASRIARVFHSL